MHVFQPFFAATEEIEKIAYIGLDGEGEVSGYPVSACIAPYALDPKNGILLRGMQNMNQELDLFSKPVGVFVPVNIKY